MQPPDPGTLGPSAGEHGLGVTRRPSRCPHLPCFLSHLEQPPSSSKSEFHCRLTPKQSFSEDVFFWVGRFVCPQDDHRHYQIPKTAEDNRGRVLCEWRQLAEIPGL